MHSETRSDLDDDDGDGGFPSAHGMPADRAARIAARRAFVEMKQLFLFAAETVDDRKGAWLRSQVRQAGDPVDLWLLRGPLLASLRLGDEAATRQLRAALYRQLDSTFPETFGVGAGWARALVPQPWEIQAFSATVPAPLRA